MKKYNPIYFLLFILLIMGAFASMAQNSYGLKIIGGVAFVFALVFFVEFISVIRNIDKKDVYTIIEPLCLFILSFIFGLRVFYIHFPFIELLFGTAGVLLMLVYLRKMTPCYRKLRPQNSLLAMLVLVFHLSIVLYLFSLIMISFVPKMAIVSGVGAFVFLMIFSIAHFFQRDLLVDGEKVTAFKMVTQFKDHSVIIVSLFLLLSLYVGLNSIGLLPGIYSDEYPRAYYEMVDKAAMKKEKPGEGKYEYQEFMKKYEQFLEHQNIRDK